jgi:hypothetical protein
MTSYSLLIANPPHGAVDAERGGAWLGLTAQQFLGKVRYGVPEIWLADEDSAMVAECRSRLEEAGCRVAVLDARALTRVTERSSVRSFEFGETNFVAHLDEYDVEVAYDEPMVGVYCRPREPAPDLGHAARGRRTSSMLSYRDRILEGSGSGAGAREAEDHVAFLDLFLTNGATAGRITVLQNAVNFAGLGRVEPRAATNMDNLVGTSENRFPHGRFDRRLVGMRLRSRMGGMRPPGAEHRHGFSYASPELVRLLGSVDERLATVSQPEMCSRLAYLTQRTG